MITIFICIFALLLAVIGFCLLKKPRLFLPLIGDTPEHRQFLHGFGLGYFIVALVGIPVAIWGTKLITFAYLFIALLITLTFSIRFSGKMKQPK